MLHESRLDCKTYAHLTRWGALFPCLAQLGHGDNGMTMPMSSSEVLRNVL